jgi:hypothetical protein
VGQVIPPYIDHAKATGLHSQEEVIHVHTIEVTKRPTPAPPALSIYAVSSQQRFISLLLHRNGGSSDPSSASKVSIWMSCVLKLFYGSIATGATHGGSLIGGAKTLRVQARRTRWFEPPERNTLRPQENVRCIIVCNVPL